MMFSQVTVNAPLRLSLCMCIAAYIGSPAFQAGKSLGTIIVPRLFPAFTDQYMCYDVSQTTYATMKLIPLLDTPSPTHMLMMKDFQPPSMFHFTTNHHKKLLVTLIQRFKQQCHSTRSTCTCIVLHAPTH